MNVIDSFETDRYMLYNADSCELLQELESESFHISIYSPPFATSSGRGLYQYSSSERDLSNSRSYEEFFRHYEFLVREIHRLTIPGRVSAVHCTDIPLAGANLDGELLRLPRRHHPNASQVGIPLLCPLSRLEGASCGPESYDGERSRPQANR